MWDTRNNSLNDPYKKNSLDTHTRTHTHKSLQNLKISKLYKNRFEYEFIIIIIISSHYVSINSTDSE